MNKVYTVWAHKNVRLEPLEIEADSELEAFDEYVRRVHAGEVEIDNPQWSELGAGDCNATYKS